MQEKSARPQQRKKAKEEYRKYKELQSAELSRGEKDYIAALESAEQKMLKKSDQ